MIEPSSWKTLKALKVVEFPIGAPADEEEKIVEKNDSTESKEIPQLEDTNASTSNNEITLDKLMGDKK